MNRVKAAIALVFFIAPSSSASKPLEPMNSGSWEREYPSNPDQYSAIYSIGIGAPLISEAEARIEKIVVKAGGKTLPQQGYMGGGGAYQQQQPQKILNYEVPAESAEKAAKKILEVAVLRHYNVQRIVQPALFLEIKERIRAFSKELKDNEEALKTMPIATDLLTSRLDRLKSAEANHGAALKRVSLSIAFYQEEPAPKK